MTRQDVGSSNERHNVAFIYANNEPKSVLAQDLGDCRDNLRNSRSVFLIDYVNIIIKKRIMTEE